MTAENSRLRAALSQIVEVCTRCGPWPKRDQKGEWQEWGEFRIAYKAEEILEIATSNLSTHDPGAVTSRENEQLRAALSRIAGMAARPACLCGREIGMEAICMCARRALAKA